MLALEGSGAVPLLVSTTWVDCHLVCPNRLPPVGAAVSRNWRRVSVANRLAPHPTRLETRTKESNMCASRRVLRNPKAQ